MLEWWRWFPFDFVLIDDELFNLVGQHCQSFVFRSSCVDELDVLGVDNRVSGILSLTSG